MIAPSTINTKPLVRVASAAFSDERDVPTSFFEAGAKSPESSSPGGKHSPKAIAFWQRKNALRKQPHRCTRCAKPNANGHKQCDACRAYAAEYRARKRAEGLPPVEPKTLADLEKRVANLEHYFARFSTLARVEYKRGYCAGRRLHRKAQERASYYNAMPHGTTAQELAEISHEHRR